MFLTIRFPDGIVSFVGEDLHAAIAAAAADFLHVSTVCEELACEVTQSQESRLETLQDLR